MKTCDFYFDLPDELIAQYPPEVRGTCRLLKINKEDGSISHNRMTDFLSLIPKDSLIIFNNTRVRKSRLFAQNIQTGGKIEIFLVKQLNETDWECLTSKTKKQTLGKKYLLPKNVKAEIVGIGEDHHRIIRFSQELNDTYLEECAHVPLPPYIKRDDKEQDSLRYQTVFADETGSSAAPTASLHFTEEILQEMKNRGIEYRFVTLHVGLGTFSPVREVELEDHKMHEEEFSICDDTANAIEKAKKEGRKILAVGTTSLRALESAWKGDSLSRGFQKTDIFIYPGYQFKVVDKLFTNFHTPESTLLMLVSAFAGTEHIRRAYDEAIKESYMFFSYGDAMLIG